MSAKKVVELTYELYETQEKLTKSQKHVTKLTNHITLLKMEIEALRLDNKQLRMRLLCDQCRSYLQSKLPGDTIVEYDCAKCIGIH